MTADEASRWCAPHAENRHAKIQDSQNPRTELKAHAQEAQWAFRQIIGKKMTGLAIEC